MMVRRGSCLPPSPWWCLPVVCPSKRDDQAAQQSVHDLGSERAKARVPYVAEPEKAEAMKGPRRPQTC